MTGPAGRHRHVPPPPPEKPPAPRASRRAVAGTVALVAVAAVVLGAVIVYDQRDRADERASATTSNAVSTAPATETTAGPLPEQLDAATRDSFFELTTDERGFTPYYGDRGVAPALGLNVCSQINADATSDGVWAAARSLEDGQYAFPDDAAWAFVSISVTVYCAEHEALVAETIAEVTG